MHMTPQERADAETRFRDMIRDHIADFGTEPTKAERFTLWGKAKVAAILDSPIPADAPGRTITSALWGD